MSNIDKLRKIVEEQQARKIGKLLVDMTTANCIVNVHNALNEENQEKFGQIIENDLIKASQIAWKLVK